MVSCICTWRRDHGIYVVFEGWIVPRVRANNYEKTNRMENPIYLHSKVHTCITALSCKIKRTKIMYKKSLLIMVENFCHIYTGTAITYIFKNKHIYCVHNFKHKVLHFITYYKGIPAKIALLPASKIINNTLNFISYILYVVIWSWKSSPFCIFVFHFYFR